MFLYVIAAAVSAFFSYSLGYWILHGKEYPDLVLRQMVAGCWFFGIGAIVCLMAAPLINILEKQYDTVQTEVPMEVKK